MRTMVEIFETARDGGLGFATLNCPGSVHIAADAALSLGWHVVSVWGAEDTTWILFRYEAP